MENELLKRVSFPQAQIFLCNSDIYLQFSHPRVSLVISNFLKAPARHFISFYPRFCDPRSDCLRHDFCPAFHGLYSLENPSFDFLLYHPLLKLKIPSETFSRNIHFINKVEYTYRFYVSFCSRDFFGKSLSSGLSLELRKMTRFSFCYRFLYPSDRYILQYIEFLSTYICLT